MEVTKGRHMIERMKRFVRRWRGFDSDGYWERRYAKGGNSGVGSYGRLAEFKAEVVNDLVRNCGLKHIVDWGFGDGNQLKLFHVQNYTGIDVSQTAVDKARTEWSNDSAKSFLHVSEVDSHVSGDLVLSFDVLYHLIEDKVFHQYMMNLVRSSSACVLIYSTNRESQKIDGHHVMDREFTIWMEDHAPQFELIEMIPNRYPYNPEDTENTSSADFWLYKCHEQK